MYQYSIKLNDARIPTLVREKVLPGRRNQLKTSHAVASFMNTVFELGNQAEEYGYLLCLDANCNVNAIMNVSHGSVNQTLMNSREILIRALLAGAVLMVIVHNHPSGNVSPSKADIQTTTDIKKAGEIVGIQLVDHIIVGIDGDYYSLAEQGYI